jgi:hypothetical protein
LERTLAWLILLLSLLVIARPSESNSALAAGNPIVTENQQAGTGAWQYGLLATDSPGQIKGYASATSVNQNQSIALYVTVNPAQTYTIDVYRIGWYGGLGGRQRLHVGPLSGSTQQPCLPDSSTGLIACSWTPSYTLTIPSDWTSGIYLALLTNAGGYQNYIVFVVKDGRSAPLLYQQPVTTYAAYNNYPNDYLTGKSLYAYNSYGAITAGGNTRAVKVSFDRPYTADGAGQFFWWEIDFVRWLERSGYDVTYSTDVDTHANGAALKNSRGFLSVAHDEYWSKQMFDAVQAARDASVNIAFFGANAVYWQIRFEASAGGVPNRVIVCYKDAAIDPVQGPTTTTNFRSAPVNRAEQQLLGIQYTSQVSWSTYPWENNVPYVVTNSANWVYAGTGFKDGDKVPGLVGYEMDRDMSNYLGPSTPVTLLSHSPFIDGNGAQDYASSSIYQATSSAWVFAAGTLGWSYGLDNYSGANLVDARIQRTTANILDKFSGPAPVASQLRVTAPSSATGGQPFTVTVAAVDSAGNIVPSYNGTVHFASSDTAAGVSLPGDSRLTNGQGSFSVTLQTTGSQTLTVSDAAKALSTTVTVTIVRPTAASKFLVAAPASATAGQSFTVTVTAVDALGNTVPTYGGTVHFSSSDTSSGVVLPADSKLTNGRGSFAVTLIKVGSQSVTATDTVNPITGSATVQVAGAAATRMTVAAPASAVAGSPVTVTVTLFDQYGNLATGYTGTVNFWSNDNLATLPANYAFATADAGSHAFSVVFRTTSSATFPTYVSGQDTVRSSLNATSQGTVVSPF